MNTSVINTMKYFCFYLSSAPPPHLLICLSSIKVSFKGEPCGWNIPKTLTVTDIEATPDIVKTKNSCLKGPEEGTLHNEENLEHQQQE